jgi:SAM-dependent methyltransferase
MTSLAGFLRQTAKAILPDSARRTVKRAAILTRAVNARLRLGFDVEPLSYVWGFDRGLPLHRYYLEQFLEEFRADIRGHCLEFRDDSYTHRFGGGAVAKLDILHLDDSHPAATIVADLTKPNDVPSNAFDCIVCTQVLHLIFEVEKAVAEMWRILKPGGVLLATVPHISMCDPGWHEVWRFTPEGLGALVGKAFGSEAIAVRAYGNSLTAAGELRGLVAEESTKATLAYSDPRFALEVCVRAKKLPATGFQLPDKSSELAPS